MFEGVSVAIVTPFQVALAIFVVSGPMASMGPGGVTGLAGSRRAHCGIRGAQVETPAPTMRRGASWRTTLRSCWPLLSLSS